MAARLTSLLLVMLLSLAGMRTGLCQDRVVRLRPGTPSRLALDRAYATVIVGDPKIVDVETGDRESVLIEPLRPGKTNLVFIDAQGLVIANVRVTVCGASDACTATAGEI